MKRLTLLLGVLMITMASATTLMAQPPGGDRVEALKISFITDELALTPDEAKTFWPVFNQFEAERKALRKQYHSNGSGGQKDIENMSDSEALAFINNQIEFEQKDINITKKYIAEFKKILPVKKVALLMTVENKFKRMILERYKGQQGGSQR